MMDNGFIPPVTKPASLQPVDFCRLIHQHFPAASVTTNLRGRSGPFTTNVLWLWQQHKTVFYGDLLQLQYLGITTIKVWTCLLCLLDIKPSRRGRQDEKSNHTEGCLIFWGICSNPNRAKHHCTGVWPTWWHWARSRKSPVLCLMLCCYLLEILSNYLSKEGFMFILH